MPDNEYATYVLEEWNRFFADPKRLEDSLAALEGRAVRSALDIGCGAGQELTPFSTQGAFVVGIDIAPEVGVAGRDLFRAWQPEARVAFARAGAEDLPFSTESFDVVICRVSLPYMDNDRALREMGRVLKAGGVLLLKIHHARYYLRKFMDGLRAGDVRSMIHSMRVFLNGSLYHFFGWQSLRKPVGRETFQTRKRLERAIAPLHIAGELPDSNPLTPSFVIVKK